MVTFLIIFALVMKQLFMCLESLTNIMQEFGQLKTHTLLGRLNVTAQRLMCGADFCVTKLLDHFFFDEKAITADIHLHTLTEYVWLI